jgi:hypothetical protein
VPITKSCEFESCSWQGVHDATLYDEVCQWFVAGRWFSSAFYKTMYRMSLSTFKL